MDSPSLPRDSSSDGAGTLAAERDVEDAVGVVGGDAAVAAAVVDAQPGPVLGHPGDDGAAGRVCRVAPRRLPCARGRQRFPSRDGTRRSPRICCVAAASTSDCWSALARPAGGSSRSTSTTGSAPGEVRGIRLGARHPERGARGSAGRGCPTSRDDIGIRTPLRRGDLRVTMPIRSTAGVTRAAAWPAWPTGSTRCPTRGHAVAATPIRLSCGLRWGSALFASTARDGQWPGPGLPELVVMP